MRGKIRSLSLARKLVIELMAASVPLVVVRRTMRLGPLVTARSALAVRPGWAALIAKAFAIVARDDPALRTFYLKWPLPHLYEVPKSLAMLFIERNDFDEDALFMLKLGATDEMSIAEIEAVIQHGKTAPVDEVASLKKALRIVRLPQPLRRLMLRIALNIGRQRANYFGTFAVTSVTTSATLGSATAVANTMGPTLISYGTVEPDGSAEMLIHWDHRIYDGTRGALALRRLEEVLNTKIADELRRSQGGSR